MATHICRWSWLFSFLFRLQLPLALSIYSVNFASFLLSLPLLVRCLGAKIMKFFVQTALRRRLLQRLDNSPFQKKKFSRSVLYSLLSYFEIYVITMSSCWRLCFLLSFIGGWTLSIICFFVVHNLFTHNHYLCTPWTRAIAGTAVRELPSLAFRSASKFKVNVVRINRIFKEICFYSVYSSFRLARRVCIALRTSNWFLLVPNCTTHEKQQTFKTIWRRSTDAVANDIKTEVQKHE